MVKIQIDLTNETNKLVTTACKMLGVTKQGFCKHSIFEKAYEINQKTITNTEDVEILGGDSKKNDSSSRFEPNSTTQNHKTTNKNFEGEQ